MPKEDPARAACRERCAKDSGDPPCYELDENPRLHGGGEVKVWKPCADCLRDIGEEVIEPLDPDAAVRPLL